MKAFLKIAKILCYVVGFPVFFICAIVASSTNIAAGKTYGIGAYSGVIVAGLFTLIWFIIIIVMEVKFKKNPPKNARRKIKKQTAKMAICALLLSAGLMMILDAVLPGIFPGLTSGTIFYEDIAEKDGVDNKSNLHKELLDTIIGRSILAGVIGDGDSHSYASPYKTSEKFGQYTGLPLNDANQELKMSKYGYWVIAESYNVDSAFGNYAGKQDGKPSDPVAKTEAELAAQKAYFQKMIDKYCKEGYKNVQVKSLIDRKSEFCQYVSLNLSGYESWVGPWVDLANAGRMTIPVVLNLIIGQRQSVVSNPKSPGGPLANDNGTRQMQDALQSLPTYNPETGKVEMVQVGWTVLDMMGDYTPDVFSAKPALALNLVGEEGLWTMLKSIELAGTTLGDLLGDTTFDNLLKYGTTHTTVIATLIDVPSIYGLVDSLLTSVSAAVGNPAIAGTPSEGYENNWKIGFGTLVLKLQNSDGTSGVTVDSNYYPNVGNAASGLGIYPNNYGRGTIDYQQQSWVDANGLLFIIYGLFGIRKVCYIFAGINVLLAVIIGAIRMKLNNMEIQSVPVAVPQNSSFNSSDDTSVAADNGYDYTSGDNQYIEPAYEAPEVYYGNVDGN